MINGLRLGAGNAINCSDVKAWLAELMQAYELYLA